MDWLKKISTATMRASRFGLCRRLYLLAGVLWLSCFFTVNGYAITLDQCIKLALDHNPELQQKELNLKISHQEMTDQRSQNLGKFDFVSTYTHFNLPHTLVPLTPASISANPADVPTTQDLYSTGILYQLQLFTGFSRTRAVEIADLQKKIANSTLKLSREQLIYNVKILYVNILSLKARSKSQLSYIEALQDLYDNVSLEFKYGRKAKIDQLKSAAALQSAITDRQGIETNIAIMKASLETLLGGDRVDKLVDINLLPDGDISPRINNESDLDISGLERVRAAQLALQKSHKAFEKSGSALYPQIVFNTAYSQNFGPNDENNKNSGDWHHEEVWEAALNLKWNIFDFGGNKARIAKARIAESQSRLELKKVELELRRALKEAVSKINLALSNYQNAKTERAMTTETVRIEEVRFKQGVATINELLDAKAKNQLAESRFVAARYNYKNALFYLDYLLESGTTTIVRDGDS